MTILKIFLLEGSGDECLIFNELRKMKQQSLFFHSDGKYFNSKSE